MGRTFAELPYATHFDKPATHSVAQAELQCLLTRSAGWPAHFEGSPRSLRGELCSKSTKLNGSGSRRNATNESCRLYSTHVRTAHGSPDPYQPRFVSRPNGLLERAAAQPHSRVQLLLQVIGRRSERRPAELGALSSSRSTQPLWRAYLGKRAGGRVPRATGSLPTISSPPAPPTVARATVGIPGGRAKKEST